MADPVANVRRAAVDWLGEADRERKPALLAAARCLLFPIQWEEPFGLVMAEALACGTPVVALRRGSVPEVVTHGETGWVCDDVGELVDALRRAGSLSPARCRANAEERFDVSLMAQRYESVYRSVVGRAAGGDGRGLQLVSGR